MLGGVIPHTEVHCALKRQSREAMFQIYETLSDLGFEGSFVNSLCPVADTEQWTRCPFRKDQ